MGMGQDGDGDGGGDGTWRGWGRDEGGDGTGVGKHLLPGELFQLYLRLVELAFHGASPLTLTSLHWTNSWMRVGVRERVAHDEGQDIQKRWREDKEELEKSLRGDGITYMHCYQRG